MGLLDTEVYKGNPFTKTGILDIKSYYKPTNTFYSGVARQKYSVFKIGRGLGAALRPPVGPGQSHGRGFRGGGEAPRRQRDFSILILKNQ